MIIDIILPYKEIFSSDKASAVSLTIKNSAEFSRFKNKICVYGQITKKPFQEIKFRGVKTNKFLHYGNNNSIFINYNKTYNHNNNQNEKKIIEFHNRPYVFNMAIKKQDKYPMTLHFHNDPRTMLGSKTVKQRISIAQNAAAVYFVSEYIKDCFLDSIGRNFNNLFVIPNGIQRVIKDMPIKKKKILFIGRLVHDKGCHLFVNSIREIVKKNIDWEFLIIGTPKAGEKKLNSAYAINLINDFNSFGKNTKYLGFVENYEVKKILEKTAILVVPSIWQEPFALTALEGMCSGAAVIASKVGGMREMLADTGLLIDDINETKLEKAINSLIINKELLQLYQSNSWNNYKYNQTDVVIKQDVLRNKIFNDYYK